MNGVALSAKPPQVDLAFFPDYRVSNPYQDMLYAKARSSGISIAPLPLHVHSFVHPDASPSRPYVFHLHWTSMLLNYPDEQFARLVLDKVFAALDKLEKEGGTLLWTVHNILPHQVRHLSLEVELRSALAEKAALIHVLNPATVEQTKEYYRLPEDKVRLVPHSSYAGIYPDTVSRCSARRKMNIADTDFALLYLGRLGDYKGVDRLLDAFDIAAARRPNLRLLIAGGTTSDEQRAALSARCAENPRIISDLRHVPDEQIQLWFRAADLMVLPFTSVLNSGSVQLAATFGLPLVIPDLPTLDGVESSWSVRFPADGDAARLAETILIAVSRFADAEAVASARKASMAYPPESMSEDFLD